MSVDPENENQKPITKPTPLWCSSRLPFFILCCFATLNFIMQRVNINFALVCMVKTSTHGLKSDLDMSLMTTDLPITEQLINDSFSSEYLDSGESGGGHNDYNTDTSCIAETTGSGNETKTIFQGDFEWDKATQANILASFYYGFILTQILGGWVSDKFGGKKAFIGSIAVLSILTLTYPVAAKLGPEYLFIVRVVQGLSHGACMPLMNVLSARWAGTTERAFLMGIAYGGFSVAAFITNPLCAFLCKTAGWPFIFYVTGGLGVLWCVIALFVVYDWPDVHPRISAEELAYLKNNTAIKRGEGPRKKLVIPWKGLLLSVPVNVTHLTHFCVFWSFNTVGMYLPIFLKEVLKMDISKNGLYSAFPFLGMLILHLWSGSFFDKMRSKEFCSLTVLRKIFNTTGLLIAGISVAFIGLLSCTDNLVGILAISTGHAFIEFAVMGGYFFSIFELAPRFSGILTGITNTFGVLSGIICPVVVGYLTQNGTREEWLIVFYIAAGFNLLGAILYLLWGSSELQPWAADESPKQKERELKVLQERLIVPIENTKI